MTTKIGSQQKQSPEEGTPEGGPIPLHGDTTITNIVWHVLQYKMVGGETLSCAIVRAVKGGGGVPKQGGCLQIIVLVLGLRLRTKRISCKGQLFFQSKETRVVEAQRQDDRVLLETKTKLRV